MENESYVTGKKCLSKVYHVISQVFNLNTRPLDSGITLGIEKMFEHSSRDGIGLYTAHTGNITDKLACGDDKLPKTRD